MVKEILTTEMPDRLKMCVKKNTFDGINKVMLEMLEDVGTMKDKFHQIDSLVKLKRESGGDSTMDGICKHMLDSEMFKRSFNI